MVNTSLFKKIFLVFLLILFCSKSLIAIENKILIKVNNQIITSVDILNEINYLKILNPKIENLGNERLFEISKNSLIKEKVKIINLLKIIDKIYIEDKYLDNLVSSIYKQKNINSLEEYKLYLNNNNLNLDYIKNKITVERLWNEMIFKKFNSKVKIDREKIKNEILNNPDEKFLLSEILIAKSKDDKVKLKYKKIEKDIQEEGFANAALIHSISETATKGGKIGWIEKSSLNKLLRTKLSKLEIGEYTKPILTPSGYLIILLENKKKSESSMKNIEKKIERLIRIKTNQQLIQFSNIYLNKLKKDVVINEL